MISEYLSVKNKYYLNGFDWVMGTIDLIMKNTTCAGNASQIVFMLESPPDEERVRSGLADFLDLFPVIAGSVSRHWTLTPYWKMPKRGRGGEQHLPLKVTRIDPSLGGDLLSVLAGFVNTPFRSERDHLAFHLVFAGPRQCLALRFDHRLFDARGAESFVGLLQQFLATGDRGVAGPVRITQGFDLTRWKDKFLAGQTVQRKIMAFSKDAMRAVPVDLVAGQRSFGYRVISFDPEETAAITARAYQEAGYLMVMPYLFSLVIEGMHRLFERRGSPPGCYVIPVSTDVRKAKDIREQLFFNHNSMFFFQVRPEDAGDRKRVLAAIKTQLYEMMQVRFPEKLMAASALMRIAPLPVIERIFHLPLGGKIASFCFSHVSKDSFVSPDLFGTRIVNMFHMPRTPVPPGVGVFFNTYAGRLNATISCLEGLFSPEELDGLEQDLKCNL